MNVAYLLSPVNGYSPRRDTSIHEVLQYSPPPPEIPATPSPFVAKTPADPKERQRERKSMARSLTLQLALTTLSKNNKKGTSEHGTIPLAFTGNMQPSCTIGVGSSTYLHLTAHYYKLARDDRIYLQSQDVYKKAQRKVTFWPLCFPLNLLI